MKRKAAYVLEEDPETGEEVIGTESTASFFLSPEEGRRQRKLWKRSASDFVSDSSSSHLGPVLDVIKQLKEERTLLTIVAGEYLDNAEVWKKCLDSGTKFRLFPLKDKVINDEYQTYVAREILLSKESDLDCENPEIIIAQRKCAVNGTVSLEAHRLSFNGHVDVNRPYIFPKLGDEIPGVGYPDLHCTFRGIRDWSTVVKKANFAGCDHNVDIEINAKDIVSEKDIVFDIEREEVVVSGVKPTFGVLISCVDFKQFYDGDNGPMRNRGEPYPSPPSKKRKLDDSTRRREESPRTIRLKLIGMGPEIDNGALRADLNVNLLLKY